MTTLREAEQAVIDAAIDVDMVRMLSALSTDPVAAMKGALGRLSGAVSTLVTEHREDNSAFAVDWEIGCAYAAGRASVLGSAEMAVVLKIAEAEADFLREAARYTGPKPPNPRIAAIRAAIEGLR
jgi:hypothetical protein